ncbi:hypothetical protein CSIM01_02244 [Colletotrichum simmondsii]|uniref:Uncharacterized protein n=1 Tax=Colletotrichum simmondsii TaxID=703756 RepID=A0A135SDC3_9PEZI|nr:hypothetical protein CSIM01_02244 [Colletotrichum simmondsii]
MERVVRSNKKAEVGQCDKSKREANISRECDPKSAGVCFQSRSRGLEVSRKEAAHRIAPRRPEEVKTSDFKIRGRGYFVQVGAPNVMSWKREKMRANGMPHLTQQALRR